MLYTKNYGKDSGGDHSPDWPSPDASKKKKPRGDGGGGH